MLFVLHAIDKPDSTQLRADTRPTHLDYLADFEIPVGGPLVDENGAMCGSLLIIDVEDLPAARAFAAGDPYAKAGLFESVNIHEFKNGLWPA